MITPMGTSLVNIFGLLSLVAKILSVTRWNGCLSHNKPLSDTSEFGNEVHFWKSPKDDGLLAREATLWVQGSSGPTPWLPGKRERGWTLSPVNSGQRFNSLRLYTEAPIKTQTDPLERLCIDAHLEVGERAARGEVAGAPQPLPLLCPMCLFHLAFLDFSEGLVIQ